MKAYWWAVAATLLGAVLLAVPASAAATKPKVSIADAPKVTEAPGGVTQRFKVSLSRKLTHKVTFDWATYDGTAEAGAFKDYNESTGNGQINAGKLSTKFTVQVLDDDTPEPKEAYGVAISNVHGAKLGVHKNANGFIKDNDDHESEPNNSALAANPITEYSLTGAHFSYQEQDWFSFQAQQNGNYLVHTSPYGEFNCTVGGPDQIDTYIQVFTNSGMTFVDDGDNISGSNYCTSVSFAATNWVTYFIQVTHGSATPGAIFDYTLETSGPP
jgi:hypothetical protein